MKINMWLIAEKMAKYNPNCDIKDGSSTIDGIRFMEEPDAQTYENRYVYLCTENSSHEKTGSDIMLINGEDLILLHSQDTEKILNSLLDTFEFYNHWESSLWELSVNGNLQQLLDKGGEALNNPMVLTALDGSVLAIGRGNPDWNYSAPHGAGRLMSRSTARSTLSLDDYKETMKGVYSTSIDDSTLDEAPMAYKSLDDIIDVIRDSVDVIDIMKPIYNFKASE